MAVGAVGGGADLVRGGGDFVAFEELADGALAGGLAEADAINKVPLAGVKGGFEVGFVFAGVPSGGGRGLATVGLALEFELDGVGFVVAALSYHFGDRLIWLVTEPV